MSTEKKLSLVRKLSEVMGEVERVAKSGRNEFHKYDYATESDIVQSVRSEMSKRQLMLIPDVESVEWKDIAKRSGGTERLCTMRVRFTIHDGESGESQSFVVLGEGQDPGDKATYKALTGATKYALLKLFLIPTGDDPEQDEKPQARQQQSRPPPPQQSQPPAHTAAKAEAQKKVDATLGREPPAMGFGNYKGKTLANIPFDGLMAAVQEAEAKLAAAPPNAKWVKPLSLNLEAIRSELATRETASAGEVGAAG